MHAAFMQRCLELAEEGRGRVSPNPMVGCVLVNGGSVITEGAHAEAGGAHAEVVALQKAGELARGALLYVNLEPCCTQGKQPPCTEAILASGVHTVVFGSRDPSNPGARMLKEHGIKIVSSVLEPQCRRLNRGFFSIKEQGRPWVTLKKALKHDGTVPSKHITNKQQDCWSHTRLRAMHDAILVGSGTVLNDNPSLTVRYGIGPSPRRVVLDPHHEVPPNALLLSDDEASSTIIIRETLPIPTLLDTLMRQGITSLLVEGGPKVWRSFEESELVDEIVTLSA